jgi:ribosomal protein L11 methylase PrmA
MTGWLEVSLAVNGELAEAVADVLARFAPNGVAVESNQIEFTSDEDEGTPVGGVIVRAYLPADEHVEEARRKLEEALYYLGMIQPLPEATFTPVADQNWMADHRPCLAGFARARAHTDQDRPRDGFWDRHTPNNTAVPGAVGRIHIRHGAPGRN